MNTPTKAGLEALTEKEKQTLRLMVRGHDAKSIARSLDLSAHTINERLRDARRKLVVSSSREAARLLLDAEGDMLGLQYPDSVRDSGIREDACHPPVNRGGAPIGGVRRAYRHPRILTGVFIMTLALGVLMLAALPQMTSPPSAGVATETPDTEVTGTAREWLALLDQGRWEESYRATGTSFQHLNTAQVWASVSEKVRAPLGTAISRTLFSQEDLPAPPHGYQVVKFRTRFASKSDAIETVTLDREAGVWRVVGVTVG